MKASQFIKENYTGFEDEFTDSELLDIKDCMKDYSEQQNKELIDALMEIRALSFGTNAVTKVTWEIADKALKTKSG